MKNIYIAPQVEIETLCLKNRFMAENEMLGYAKYSPTTYEMHTNTTEFDEDNQGYDLPTARNLWDE